MYRVGSLNEYTSCTDGHVSHRLMPPFRYTFRTLWVQFLDRVFCSLQAELAKRCVSGRSVDLAVTLITRLPCKLVESALAARVEKSTLPGLLDQIALLKLFQSSGERALTPDTP